jgi:thioredoxin-like negative regulator of GroEL
MNSINKNEMNNFNRYFLIGIGAFLLLIYLFLKNKCDIEKIKKTIYEESMTNEQKKPLIILYFSPNCGHCTQFMENGWGEFKTKTNNNTSIDVKQISCDDNPESCANLNIEGYPTVILFHENNNIVYEGDRSLDSLVAFVKQHTTIEC